MHAKVATNLQRCPTASTTESAIATLFSSLLKNATDYAADNPQV